MVDLEAGLAEGCVVLRRGVLLDKGVENVVKGGGLKLPGQFWPDPIPLLVSPLACLSGSSRARTASAGPSFPPSSLSGSEERASSTRSMDPLIVIC